MNKPLKVLSLFDGMSCGQIALERAGFTVDTYYASEIDKHAITVTQFNYPKTVQLGDVTKVTGLDVGEIDLLIGGSPCQGFSFAGKQLNFEDPRSKLFFEFVRLLNETKPKYFLLENVKMKKESEDVISSYLGVKPIEINSALVSAQNRRRLYWTNIPNVTQPEDKGILLRDILETGKPRKHTVKALAYMDRVAPDGRSKWGFKYHSDTDSDKSACLTQNWHKGVPNNVLIDRLNNCVRYFEPVEAERLQTVPENYTAPVSNTQRYRMLGNGWTVDVIAHIFKNMNL
jgi:site-specific DNA-cytosine methylase